MTWQVFVYAAGVGGAEKAASAAAEIGFGALKKKKKTRKKNGRKLKKRKKMKKVKKKMKGGWCGLCSNRNDREEINNEYQKEDIYIFMKIN